MNSRKEARGMLDNLRRAGMRIVMLTGDRQPTAEFDRPRGGVDDVRAQLSPEAKIAAVQELKQAGGKVAMIGDGVNDAPCLAAADVGVAMGARASDAALEQAEVVLMNDRLENFVTAYNLSRRAKAIIGQNITIALGTVIVMALLAVTRGHSAFHRRRRARRQHGCRRAEQLALALSKVAQASSLLPLAVQAGSLRYIADHWIRQ